MEVFQFDAIFLLKNYFSKRVRASKAIYIPLESVFLLKNLVVKKEKNVSYIFKNILSKYVFCSFNFKRSLK